MLRQRLIRDIAELQARPYPNISLRLNDDDITEACLILTPNGVTPIYPLSAPRVTIQSRLIHPNIFGSYICASILNTDEGYTPAYILKGIAIQLLSFFGSENVEQIDSGEKVDLARYRHNSTRDVGQSDFHCPKCTFGTPLKNKVAESQAVNLMDRKALLENKRPLHRNRPGRKRAKEQAHLKYMSLLQKLTALPQEIILLVLGNLDTEELLALCGFDEVRATVIDYDLIRLRELQCFCLKKSCLYPFLTTSGDLRLSPFVEHRVNSASGQGLYPM